MARRGRKFTLEAFLKDKTYEVREAAADALNKGADIVAQRAVSNLRTQGIVNRHNKLYSSVDIKKATPERPRCLIKSEVYAPLPRGERKARQAYENWKNGNNGV